MEQPRSVHATFDNLNQDADMLYSTCHECQKAHNRSGCLPGAPGPCRRCIGEDFVHHFSEIPTALRKRHRAHHSYDRRRRLVRREVAGQGEKGLKACRRRFLVGLGPQLWFLFCVYDGHTLTEKEPAFVYRFGFRALIPTRSRKHLYIRAYRKLSEHCVVLESLVVYQEQS